MTEKGSANGKNGLSGDIAAKELGQESVIASDLIQYLPYAFKRIKE